MRLENLAARDAQLTLTVADVFRFPVLADQAGLLQPLAQAKLPEPFELMMTSGAVSFADLVTSVAEQCRVSRSQVEDTYPCTPLKEEMMCVSLSGQRTQMGQEVTQLAESLDILRFRSACNRVFQRFPILRTWIVRHSDKLVQVVIQESLDWKLPKSLPEYVAADARQPPALGKPLTRWALTSEPSSSPGRGHCIITIHHALFDGIALHHILGAILDAYQAIPLPQDVNGLLDDLTQATRELALALMTDSGSAPPNSTKTECSHFYSSDFAWFSGSKISIQINFPAYQTVLAASPHFLLNMVSAFSPKAEIFLMSVSQRVRKIGLQNHASVHDLEQLERC